MQLFIASHFRETATTLMRLLQDVGVGVVARWITQDTKFHRLSDAYSDDERRAIAQMDEEDVRAATGGLIVIAEPDGQTVPGGKHVETGIAIALRRPVYVIGRRENIFHWHPLVRVFTDSGDLLRVLSTTSDVTSLGHTPSRDRSREAVRRR